MISWPKTLVDSIAHRQSVLFLGSGVSRNSKDENDKHPKTWYEFLQYGLTKDKLSAEQREHIKKYIDRYDYLLACELLKNYLGYEFIELVTEVFRTPKYKHADIHETIFEIDSRIVVTPNFDVIYDNYARSYMGAGLSICNYYEKSLSQALRTTLPIIIKAHGSIDKPNDLIFTQLEYAKARTENAEFYKILDALLLTHTFLFIGAGVNDPDIKLLLENYKYQYEPYLPHYFVLPNDALNEVERVLYSKNLGVNFLLYSPADDHKELKESLVELKEKVDERREELAKCV